MSLEEELIELSQVYAAQRERIEAMEELIIDWTLLMHSRFPYTWNHGEEGIRIQAAIKALGIMEHQRKKDFVE